MSKSIEFTLPQVEAYKNGGSMFIVPIAEDLQQVLVKAIERQQEEYFISTFAPIKKGDKDIFIKEEFTVAPFTTDILYKSDGHPNSNLIDWEDASKMTKEQSRYSISECIGGRAVMVKELDYDERNNISGFLIDSGNVYFTDIYNNQLKEHNINRTYEDNDHIFLIEVKK